MKWMAMSPGLLFALACSEPTVCTTEGRYAITVRVRDGSTGAPAAFGATLIARDGAYADSVTGLYAGPSDYWATHLQVAIGRAGTYDVTVRKPGFLTWTREGVQVDRDECNVKSVTLDANLHPSSL